MDIGTAAHTEYEFGPELVEYYQKYPERVDWLYGHHHSHVGFNCFFSGEDDQALHLNAPQHDFFLSVITNNKFEYAAKLVFPAEGKGAAEYIGNIAGKKVVYSGEDNKKQCLMYLNLQLATPIVSKEVEDRVEELLKKAPVPKFTTPFSGAWNFSTERKGLPKGVPDAEGIQSKFVKLLFNGLGHSGEQASMLFREECREFDKFYTFPKDKFAVMSDIEGRFEDAFEEAAGIDIYTADKVMVKGFFDFAIRFLKSLHCNKKEAVIKDLFIECLEHAKTWEEETDLKGLNGHQGKLTL